LHALEDVRNCSFQKVRRWLYAPLILADTGQSYVSGRQKTALSELDRNPAVGYETALLRITFRPDAN
jgi:hypothetical protein